MQPFGSDELQSVVVATRDPSQPLVRRMRRWPWLMAMPLCGAIILFAACFLPWFTVTENFGVLARETTTRTAWTYWSGVSSACAAVIIALVWLARVTIPDIAARIFLPEWITFPLFGALALAGLVAFELHGLAGAGTSLPGITFRIGIGAFVAAGADAVIIIFGVFAQWPAATPSLATRMRAARQRARAQAPVGAPSRPLYLPRESIYSQPLPYTPTASQPISYGGQPTYPPGYAAPPSQPISYGGQPSQPVYGGQPSQPISYGGQPSQPVYGGQPSQPLYGPVAPYAPGMPRPTPTGPQPAMPPSYGSPPSQPLYGNPPSQPLYSGQPSQPINYGNPPSQPYQYPAAPWQPPATKPPARSLPSPFGPPPVAPPRDAAPSMPSGVGESGASTPAEDSATDTPNEDAPA